IPPFLLRRRLLRRGLLLPRRAAPGGGVCGFGVWVWFGWGPPKGGGRGGGGGGGPWGSSATGTKKNQEGGKNQVFLICRCGERGGLIRVLRLWLCLDRAPRKEREREEAASVAHGV